MTQGQLNWFDQKKELKGELLIWRTEIKGRVQWV